MKRSGYCAKLRKEVIDAGVKIHIEQLEREAAGEKVMFRMRQEMKEDKKKEGGDKQRNWYKQKKNKGKKNGNKGRIETVIMVPYTRNSELLRALQKIARKNGVNIRFIERGGHSLQNLLEKADPFKKDNCGRADCRPCEGKANGKCDSRGAAYQISCEEDECVEKPVRYDGECARPAYTRGKEHFDGYRRGTKDNPLHKHAKEEHQGRKDVNFKMEVVGTYGKDNLRRTVNESVRIEGNKGVRMNSRSEHNQPMVIRARIQRHVTND
jgi:hypothetical protein